jgi:transcriptional regulator with XRE-family HTH domain
MRMKKRKETKAVSTEAAFQIGKAVDAWRLTHAKSQRDLQDIAKVSQGQISRILAGKFSHASPPVVRLCTAAGIDWQASSGSSASQALQRRLYAELDGCWDGSRAGAQALIELLRAVGRLRPTR